MGRVMAVWSVFGFAKNCLWSGFSLWDFEQIDLVLEKEMGGGVCMRSALYLGEKIIEKKIIKG